jgi:biopolymer transport protein ExbB
MWPAGIEGWIRTATFVPIFVISVLGFALFLAKLWQYRRPAVWTIATRQSLFDALGAGDTEKVVRLARHDHSLASQLLLALLPDSGRPRRRVRERALELGARLARALESRLDGLALIATLGPLFGLFGTVVGIVLVFERLGAGAGVASPRELAAGIGTALYTTIFGLIVGVFAVVAHWYLRQRVERKVAALEFAASDLIDRLSAEQD